MNTNYDNLIEDKREAFLSGISEELEALYQSASVSMTEKLEEYLDAVQRRNTNMLEYLEAGKITQDVYNQWLYNQVVMTQSWKNLRDEITMIAVNTDLDASDMINGSLPEIYAEFYNLGGFSAYVQNGYLPSNFQLYNSETVERLVEDNIITLPYAHPDAGKDFRWNQQHINSVVSHGILTGDSIPTIARRMEEVTGMDYRIALRNARTCHNSAQNQANYDSMKTIEAGGIPMKLVWSTARDSRVRDSHILQEGMERINDELFPNGLRFPLDTQKGFDKPQEIYNCRCKGLTFIASIDHSKDIEQYDQWMQENYYEDWKRGKWVDGIVGGEIRDTWKGDNPNVARYQEEARERQRQREERQRQREAEIARLEQERLSNGNGIHRDYDSSIARAYGQENYDAICNMIDNCSDEDVRQMWIDHLNDVVVKETDIKGGFCNHAGIHLNLAEDVKGNTYEKPYAVTFHEGGHYLDRILNHADFSDGIFSPHISAHFENGAFAEALKSDMKNLVDKTAIELKEIIKSHQFDYDFLYENHYIGIFDYTYGQPVKYKKQMVYDYISRSLRRQLDPYQRSDISDMMQGASGCRISLGYGHSDAYFKKNEYALPAEAFAEMCSATLAQNESLEQIQHYFPQGYETFKRMVRRINSGG